MQVDIKPGLYDPALVADDYNRLNDIRPHALQNLGGVLQTHALARIVLRRNIPGVFVECGVAAGAQLAVMACAMEREQKRRTIHAFDSFDGIPHACEKDDQQPGLAYFPMDRSLPLEQRLKSTLVSGVPLNAVKQLWKNWKYTEITVEWHEGWFQHTLPKLKAAECSPIAFLRLDGDLYESTQCCLDYLYDRVPPGGLVFIDDWGLGGCSKAVLEFLESRNLNPVLMADVQEHFGAIYWFK